MPRFPEPHRPFPNFLLRLALFVVLPAAMVQTSLANLPLAQLETTLAGFESRRQSALNRQISNPFPSAPVVEASNTYVWNRLDFALAALYQNTQLAAANQAVIDAATVMLAANPSVYTSAEGGLHWQGNLWVRVHELFASDSRHFPGRLTPQAEEAIRAILWEWASRKGYLDGADLEVWKTWRIWESENHSAMHDASAWGAARILSRHLPYRDYTYEDGSTAAEQYALWTRFLVEYLRERGQRGMLVEYRSNTYSKYTLQGFYNYFDLADDANLRYLAGAMLDLWWADAAQESIDGIAGGAAARMARPDDVFGERHGVPQMLWYYTGEGQTRNLHPGLMCLITSQYRLPLVIADLALDEAGRGSFEAWSRRPGLNLAGYEGQFSADRTYILDRDDGGILRYTYVTPDFVLGTHFFDKLSSARWSGISRQNRWHAALLRGHPDALIVPQVVATTSSLRGTNEQWSIQHKGTLITQKNNLGESLAGMRVYFPGASVLNREESDGWIFAWNTYAFAAVRPASGGYSWVDGNWIELGNQYSPVIVEVVRSSDFSSFAAFRSAVLAQSIDFGNSSGAETLLYTSLLDRTRLTFFMSTASTQSPLVNGQALDHSPSFAYRSPFLEGAWPNQAVDFGADYTKSNLNATTTPTLTTVDADFDGQVDDRAAVVTLGTVFSPPTLSGWTTPVGKSGAVIRHGISLANLNSGTNPSIQLNRINAADVIQVTNGVGTGAMRMATAFYWERQEFLNGLDTAEPLSFVDAGDSAQATLVNAGAATAEDGRASRLLVRSGGIWYVSGSTFNGTAGSLAFNGRTETWYRFEPAAGTLFWNSTAPGNPFSGTELDEITAVGVYSQHDLFDGSTLNHAIHGLSGLTVSLSSNPDEVPVGPPGTVRIRKGQYEKVLNFRADFSDPSKPGEWASIPSLGATLVALSPYGPERARLDLQLSHPAPFDIPVYVRVGGAASFQVDLVPSSNPIIIPAGSSAVSVDVTRLAPDQLLLQDSSIEVYLSQGDRYAWDYRNVFPLSLPLLPYDQWRATHFDPAQQGNPAISGPEASANGDGIANILKYLNDQSPWAAHAGLRMKTGIIDGKMQILLFRSSKAVDVDYWLEQSAELSTWHFLPADRFSLDPDGLDSTSGAHFVEALLPLENLASEIFFRLRIAHPLR